MLLFWSFLVSYSLCWRQSFTPVDYINSDGQLFGSAWSVPLILDRYTFSSTFIRSIVEAHHSNGTQYSKNRETVISIRQPIQWTIIYFVNFVLIVLLSSPVSAEDTLNERSTVWWVHLFSDGWFAASYWDRRFDRIFFAHPFNLGAWTNQMLWEIVIKIVALCTASTI